MQQNTFSVHFVVRNDRVDEDGYVPIYAKVTLNGQRLSLSTSQKVQPNHWNVKRGWVLPRVERMM